MIDLFLSIILTKEVHPPEQGSLIDIHHDSLASWTKEVLPPEQSVLWTCSWHRKASVDNWLTPAVFQINLSSQVFNQRQTNS